MRSQLCGVILQQKKTGKPQLEGKKTWVAENDSQRWVECHGNCGPITANRIMGDCLMCFPRVHRRGHGARSSVPGPNLRHCLSGWHLKCCFLTTYANCCNFPDEVASWYLDAAKIVLHFLCRAPLGHLVRVVSAWSATESQQNCKQIASDCQHCEKVNCLQIYLNHWPIFISHSTWYSWLLNWWPFLLCSALWCNGKRSLPNQLCLFSRPTPIHYSSDCDG